MRSLLPPSIRPFCAAAAILVVAAAPSFAQPPLKRNLVVEFRQIEAPLHTREQAASVAVLASSAGSHNSATALTQAVPQADDAMPALQQVQVLNGERASFRFARAVPLQWVQAATAQVSSDSASATVSGSLGGAVVNAVTWLEAGQGLTVTPHWPGGKQAVTLEVELDTAAIDARVGTDLPAQSRSRTRTTVVTPLGQWITIATLGASTPSEQPGVYSSESAAAQPPQLIQLRVRLP